MIELVLNKIARGDISKLRSHLTEVCFDKMIENTKTKTHCYHISLDGNGRVRHDEFVEFLLGKVIDYAIPRSEIEKAKLYLDTYGSASEFSKLEKKAKALFTDSNTTGEGGELLLYILTEELLRIPQLFSKMSLKTNPRVHYHGADAIHGAFDVEKNMLSLYWGEAKMYADIKSGLKSCFESLNKFLDSTNTNSSFQQRDIQLVKEGLDLNNTDLENAIVNYLDKDHINFNRLQYKGVCFVGFDTDKYPTLPNQILNEQITPIIFEEYSNWYDYTGKAINGHPNLETFEIHVFLIPFPSVEAFRNSFLNLLGHSNNY